jgi:hypothetical protein
MTGTDESDDDGRDDSTGPDGGTDGTDLESAVGNFLRNARRVYEEYDEGYVDPDAALWTLEGHVDTLEDAFDAHEERSERD